MGNSNSSSSSATNKTNILNQSQINSFNSSLVQSAVNVMIKNASTCSQSATQQNLCQISDVSAVGPISLNAVQGNTANVTLSCLQGSKVQSAMAAEMMNKAATEMAAASKAGLQVQLAGASSAGQTSGALATGIASSNNSQTNVNNTTNVTSTMVQNATNIMKQKLDVNFTADTVNECVSKLFQSNKGIIKNAQTLSSITANCTQENNLKALTECKQLNEAVQNTVNAVLAESKIQAAAVADTSQSVTAKAESSSTQVQTGIFQDVLGGISGIFGSASNPYSMLCLCCVVIGIIILGMGALNSKSESSGLGSMSMMNKASLAKMLMGGSYNTEDMIIDSTSSLINLISSDSVYL
jgi:hypothetical protein